MKVFKIVRIDSDTSNHSYYIVYKRKLFSWKRITIYRSSISSVIRNLCAEFINPKIYIELNNKDIDNYIGKTNTRPGLGRVENKDKDEGI